MLTAVTSLTGPPLFALLSLGLAWSDRTVSDKSAERRPGPACAVLKQFMRLLRVAVENRHATDLCGSVSTLCTAPDLKALVLDAVLAEELAPAYFGVLFQVRMLLSLVL